jgi:ribonuclease R
MTQFDDISARILRHLSGKDYRPQHVQGLASEMGVEESRYDDFRSAVKELMRAGRVIRGGGNCVMLPSGSDQIIGSFRGHARGFGFVVPDAPSDHEDLFIPPGATRTALTGDTVLARITRRGKGEDSRMEGEVVEIIQRGQSRFVGELVRHAGQWALMPDGKTLRTPVMVGDVGSTRARAGDQVVVELTEFPTAARPGRGVIVEVLGRRGDPGIDTLSIIRQYHFREQFSEEAHEDARRVIREYDLDVELERREDIRSQVIVTIDPDDAKDFDDAISIRRTGRGLELGVHIADVSSLVQAGRPLDDEARVRGNSIYLPRHVIPMLPELLSNGLCSLQEGQPRLTKSAFIQYDAHGHRKSARFANTVIQSSRRLTYGQATAILEGNLDGYSHEVVSLIKAMDGLARSIRARRLAAGMIVLDIPEVDLVLDDQNEVIDVRPTDTSFSHTIIEMFMVEANEVVAELMTELGVPHLRRIHPEPPEDAQAKLSQFLRVLHKPMPKGMGRHELMKLLDSVRGQPDAFAVNLAVLRSMAQATYSPKMIGHYALASEHYSHFTSPIRRYPDLITHRLLEMHLQGELRGRRGRAAAPSMETLLEVGKRCSFTERRSEDAERELSQLKILRLLEERLGEIVDGVVTGVTNLGLFVQVNKYLVDGVVRFTDLSDDWWEINAQGGYAMGQRSGWRIAIGDPIRVQIAAVNLPARELNLAAPEGIEQPGRPTGPEATAGGQAAPKRGGRRGARAGGGPRGGGSRTGGVPRAGGTPRSGGQPATGGSPGGRRGTRGRPGATPPKGGPGRRGNRRRRSR